MLNSPELFDVFLSCRGDIIETHADPLNKALEKAHLRTFFYVERRNPGGRIDQKLQDGIKHSASAIIIFSKEYATSNWCLDELLLILERDRTSYFPIIPIYCDGVGFEDLTFVESGVYSQAFENHKAKYGKEKVRMWKEALKDVGLREIKCASGDWDLYFKYIVEEIQKKLSCVGVKVNPFSPEIDRKKLNVVMPSSSIQQQNYQYSLPSAPTTRLTPDKSKVVTQSKPKQDQQCGKETQLAAANKSRVLNECKPKQDRLCGKETMAHEASVELSVKCPPGGKDKVVLYTMFQHTPNTEEAKDSLQLKRFLEGQRVDFEERNGKKDPKFKEELETLESKLKFPALFVMGKYIGGLRDVEKLRSNGELWRSTFSKCKEAELHSRRPCGEDTVVVYTWIGSGYPDRQATVENSRNVIKILRNHNIYFEERDAKEHRKFRGELNVLVDKFHLWGLRVHDKFNYPIVFAMGKYIGGIKEVEDLAAAHQLRKKLFS